MKRPGRPYPANKVCRLAGVTYRQLDYWTRTCLVVPSVREAAGSGTQRRFSDEDLLRVKLIGALLKAGVSLQTIRRYGPKVALDRTMVDLHALSEELERQLGGESVGVAS